MYDFSSNYNRDNFINFLENNFLPEDFQQKEEKLKLNFSPKFTSSATRLGVCKSLEMEVFEIEHNSTHDARVGISGDAFQVMQKNSYCNKALVAFIPKGSNQYRFSFLQIEAEQKYHSARIQRNYSNPRRYSYLLGEGIGGYTPNNFLLGKGRVKDIKDLAERFSVEVLTKAFYGELSDWYAWAIKNVQFPGEYEVEAEEKRIEHRSKNLIRLLTRLLFVWFLKQKNLIPNELFEIDFLSNKLVKDFDPNFKTGLFAYKSNESKYYKAILQNLFFATLNCPISPQSKEDSRTRGFRKKDWHGQESGYDHLMRYEDLFINPQLFLELVNTKVPFLNGGLFDCLDDKQNKSYIDGFSDNLPKPNILIVPDFLFFGEKKGEDLSGFYGNKMKNSVNALGLIDILQKYNFTIEENTPFDQEVSLDPELLGKVFENLLASYNPETQTTARKQTGSFYTPREIVQYMVNESLIAHLKHTVGEQHEDEYRKLMQYSEENLTLDDKTKYAIIQSIQTCKVLDPACGSGAFPVGVLQQMVHILSQLDPQNQIWKNLILEESINELSSTLKDYTKEERDEIQADINRSFDDNINRPDYARKLYLIEKCIYGVDIQSIAVQISKLRFFISLVVDQCPTPNPNENFGIRPLPNLEAKFVSANTLIGLSKTKTLFDNKEIEKWQEKLSQLNHRIFGAKSNKRKNTYKSHIEDLQKHIAEKLEYLGIVGNEDARLMQQWKMFDQNTSSPFFDPEWMFGLKSGASNQDGYFDIVIGNPPYIDSETMTLLGLEDQRKYIVDNYCYIGGNWDIYMAFFEKGLALSQNSLVFITPDKWLSKPFGKKFRAECLTSRLNKITHAGSKIFKSATVDAVITVFINKSENISAYVYSSEKSLRLINSIQSTSLKAPYYIDSLFSKNNKIIEKIESGNMQKIINLAECENACATSDAYKLKQYISESPDKNPAYLKIVNTGTIDKFKNKWGEKAMSYLGAKILYPVVKRDEFNRDFGKSYIRKANSPKIIFKGLNLLDAFVDNYGDFLPGKSTLVICSQNIHILLVLCGILNSKLAIFYIKTKYSSSSYCGGITFSKDMINEFPIPYLTQSQEKIISDTVVNILNLGKTENLNSYQRKLDFLIYKSYNLTYDEVKIIDSTTNITEKEYASKSFL